MKLTEFIKALSSSGIPKKRVVIAFRYLKGIDSLEVITQGRRAFMSKFTLDCVIDIVRKKGIQV